MCLDVFLLACLFYLTPRLSYYVQRVSDSPPTIFYTCSTFFLSPFLSLDHAYWFLSLKDSLSQKLVKCKRTEMYVCIQTKCALVCMHRALLQHCTRNEQGTGTLLQSHSTWEEREKKFRVLRRKYPERKSNYIESNETNRK